MPRTPEQLLDQVETWVEPLEGNRSTWLFRFGGEDRAVGYVVHYLRTLSDDQLSLYVVEIPHEAGTDTRIDAWPLTNLDDNRNVNEPISAEAFAQRFAQFTSELAEKAFATLVTAHQHD